jgi:thymidylate synthase
MFNVIVAVSKQSNGKLGIGIGNKMAWKYVEELKIFKEKTMGNVLIMGKSTVRSLPKLNGREIYCLSRDTNTFDRSLLVGKNSVNIFQSFTDAVRDAKQRHPDKKIFVAGGEQIYDLVMNNHKHNVKELHISFMKSKHCDGDSSEEDIRECNKFFPIIPRCVCLSHKEYSDFVHYVLDINETNDEEYNYLLTLDQTLHSESRYGRNGEVFSQFSPKTLSFNLEQDTFPLLTTKRMFFRGIVEELLFFIRGDTNSKLLEEKGINIWKGNTSREFISQKGFDYPEGEMGPMYGYQWRRFNGELDQLEHVIDQIRNYSNSRRILLTDYNPLQANKGVLYPCHSIIIQFYVSDNTHLDMKVFNRSSDLFLGLPFNIASSALFLMLISKLCNLKPRNLHIDLGDAHVYEQHVDSVKTQVSRFPCRFPKLKIKKDLTTILDIENLTFEDFSIEDYNHHPSIKAEMVA